MARETFIEEPPPAIPNYDWDWRDALEEPEEQGGVNGPTGDGSTSGPGLNRKVY